MERLHEPYMEEMHIPVQDETELDELDMLVEKWKKHAEGQQISVVLFLNNYKATKADGDTLRHPETRLMTRVTYEQQKRVRAIEINRMIHHIASEEINRTEKAALDDPRFAKFRAEISGDATYLRRMLPEEVTMDHPMMSEERYRSMSNELARIKEKVVSKL